MKTFLECIALEKSIVSSLIKTCLDERCSDTLEGFFQYLIRVNHPMPFASSAAESLNLYLEKASKEYNFELNSNLKSLLLDNAERLGWIIQEKGVMNYFRKMKSYRITHEFADRIIQVMNTISYLNMHDGIIDKEDRDLFE